MEIYYIIKLLTQLYFDALNLQQFNINSCNIAHICQQSANQIGQNLNQLPTINVLNNKQFKYFSSNSEDINTLYTLILQIIFKRHRSSMNNRNTYMNSKAALTNQKDRPTTNPSNSLSKNNTEKMAVTVDRMIGKILNAIGHLSNYIPTSTISRETLKGAGSKVFFDVFYIFLKAIDPKLDRQSINLESMLEIVRLIGYNGNLNKNIFQPIGAPHTWVYCLAILEWLSQSVNYTYHFNSTCQKNPFSEDLNGITFDAYRTKDNNKISSYIDNDIQKLNQDICNISQNGIEAVKIQINNMKLGQRQIQVVEREIYREKDIIYKGRQQIIEKERTLAGTKSETNILEQQISFGEIQLQKRQKEYQDLKYQVQHQDLTTQQIDQIKRKIYQMDIHQMQEETKFRNHITAQAKNSDQFVHIFTSINGELREIYETCKAVAQRTGLSFEEIPVVINIKQFQTYFKDQKEPYDQTFVRQAIGENIICLLSHNMEALLIALKYKNEEDLRNLKLTQSQNSTIGTFKKTLRNDIEQTKTLIAQKNRQISTDIETMRQTQVSSGQISYKHRSKAQFSKIIQERKIGNTQKQANLKETKKTLQNIAVQYQQSADARTTRRKASVQQLKGNTWTVLENKLLFVKEISAEIQQIIRQLTQRL